MITTPFSFKDPVNWTIFAFSMGLIFLIFGFVFTQIAALNSNLRFLQDGQSNIKEQLIRMDERQQVNTRNVEKIVNKLNIQ